MNKEKKKLRKAAIPATRVQVVWFTSPHADPALPTVYYSFQSNFGSVYTVQGVEENGTIVSVQEWCINWHSSESIPPYEVESLTSLALRNFDKAMRIARTRWIDEALYNGVDPNDPEQPGFLETGPNNGYTPKPWITPTD